MVKATFMPCGLSMHDTQQILKLFLQTRQQMPGEVDSHCEPKFLTSVWAQDNEADGTDVLSAGGASCGCY